MAGEIANNKHLINAPAGSGKTTNIRTRLKSICLKEPKSKILCITYTNRAADELKKDLDSANVTVSTIHSYINDLISPFYPLKEALDLYWEIFKEKIEARIKNEERDEHIDQSNQHYIEKHGDLNVDLVRENLRELSYGETPFTSLYSGKLSHDDLIMFANKLIKKYPVLLRKISDKYNYIFIDEYQDTSAYILDIFYDAVVNKENIQLYLLGDRMQQIYRNYDGSFEEKLREFDTSQRLVVNHRSIGKIISILNNIYNDDSFKQDPSEKNKDIVPDISPKVIITSNVAEAVEHFQTSFPGILTLYLMNKEKYAEIGAKNLYSTYRDNKLFEALLKDDFIAYLAKSTVGNAKNIFKISKIEGILTAYKLFYVGCSRARKNLVIVVDETKINKFENEFKAKLISIGFEIQGFPMQETATV